MGNNILFKIFLWMGLNSNSKRSMCSRIINYTFYTYLILIVADCLLTSVLFIKDMHTLKVSLVYIFSYLLTILTWAVLWWKRLPLTGLIRHLQKTCRPIISTRRIRIWLIIIVNVPIFYVFFLVSTELRDGVYYSYGFEVKKFHIATIIILIKSLLFCAIHPMLSNILVLHFCIQCLQCFKSVHYLRIEIEKCSAREFDVPKQLDIMRREMKIVEALHSLQSVFSLPSFLMFISHYCACSSLLGWIVLDELKSGYKVFQTLFYLGNSLACLVACVWVPGKLPIEMSEFKEAFRKKSRFRWLHLRITEEDVFKKAFNEKQPFVFSGYNIIAFRQGSILAIVGTMLTYTLLLVKKDPATV